VLSRLGFQESFSIGNNNIGNGFPCYIIAEAGLSHLGNIDYAEQLVKIAVEAGCSAFKTQHFRVSSLLNARYAPDWYERYRSKALDDRDIIAISDMCRHYGIEFLCTPHDIPSLEFLISNKLIKCIKVGSGELNNYLFLRKAAVSGLPIILSTGMYSIDQICEAVDYLYLCGCRQLAILHCTTLYPTPPDEVKLPTIPFIQNMFTGPVGYSDHTSGHDMAIAAVALGSSVIEKHVTLFTDIPNAQDWKVSCTKATLPEFVRSLRQVELATRLTTAKNTPSKIELESIRWATKSLYSATNLDINHVIKDSDIVAMRPGIGLSPMQYTQIIGRKVVRPIKEGDLLTMEHFAPKE